MKMSILSFNASTVDREELPKIKEPFQILPGGRNFLSSKDISTFIKSNNPNILIHINYITRPFSKSPTSGTVTNLENYSKLAKVLGTKNILIHLPSNINEYESYGEGIDLIIEKIIKADCICHLEVNPLSKDLQTYLKINKENAISKYYEYLNKIIFAIPPKYSANFKLVVDTAHLFANGFDGLDMVEFIEKYKNMIQFIHFNGNSNSQFTKDKHVPMYRVDNKIKNVDELTTYISKLNITLIAEDSTEKGSYDDWKKFCDKFKIQIVKFNKIYSI